MSKQKKNFFLRSAFFWFCKDERAEVKSKNPAYTVGDIAKALGKKWADCTAEDKAKYAEMAEQDKDRYDKVNFHVFKDNKQIFILSAKLELKN